MTYIFQNLKPVFKKIDEKLLEISKYEGYKRTEVMEKNLTLAYDFLSGRIAAVPSFRQDMGNVKFSFAAMLFEAEKDWSEKDDLLAAFLSEPVIWKSVWSHIDVFIMEPLRKMHSQKVLDKILLFLTKINVPEDRFLSELCNYLSYHTGTRSTEQYIIDKDTQTPLLRYFLQKLPIASETFLEVNTKKSLDLQWNFAFYQLLCLTLPARADLYLKNILDSDIKYPLFVITDIVKLNYEKHISYVYTLLQGKNRVILKDAAELYEIHLNCYKLNKNRKPEEILSVSKEYLAVYISNKLEFPSEPRLMIEEIAGIQKLSAWALYFINLSCSEETKEWTEKIFSNTALINFDLIVVADICFPVESEYLLRVFDKTLDTFDKKSYYTLILRLLAKRIPDSYLEQLWQLDKYTSKIAKELIAQYLAKYDDKAFTRAKALLNNKKVEVRKTAALILDAIESAH
jgi:hypothetical protein